MRSRHLSFASRLSKGTIALSNIPVNSSVLFFPIGPIMWGNVGREMKQPRVNPVAVESLGYAAAPRQTLSVASPNTIAAITIVDTPTAAHEAPASTG